MSPWSFLFVCVLFQYLHISSTTAETTTAHGCDACHPTKDGYINVHLVPHTHNDVGWVETVDKYYSSMVKSILTSSLASLQKNKNRRFMYVESAFLFKWWAEQKRSVQDKFKELINNGQLELVSGGWTMNDEATTNYQSIIDQFTLGLSKINKTFGACGCPKVGWQIDPFGHSKEMASIFAQMGFDGLFLGRIDYQDKKFRLKNKTAEMIWRASASLGEKSEIFTSVLYNIYFPPNGFCWDGLCYDYFDNSEWGRLTVIMHKQARAFKTNNIILTMGGDFQYTQAELWFQNLDELIKYSNSQQQVGSKYNLIYSTPSCYLKAVREEALKAKINWPIMEDDFFPYASNSFSYWTGFYTSRPSLKRLERVGNNYLQVCKQMHVLGSLDNKYLRQIDSLKQAMAVLQHHDAITGTEQQHVADDYIKALSKGMVDCETVTYSTLNVLFSKHKSESHHIFPFSSCLLTNISECFFTEQLKRFVITIYNPLSRTVDYYPRIPVMQGYYSIRGPNNEAPLSQMVSIPKQVLNIPGRSSKATHELVFKASEIPPLGFRSYYVKKHANPPFLEPFIKKRDKNPSVKFGENGLLSEVTMNGVTIRITQEFFYYHSSKNKTRTSGAYIFRPEGAEATKISDGAQVEVHDGHVVKEVHQVFNEWVSQIIRVYPDENFIEFQWLIGPLPEDGMPSKEVVSRFKTDVKSQSIFYTDSNGRQMQKRVRNARPTWKLNLTQPIPSNYYPVSSKILIKDQQGLEVAVLTDRSQGGTSLKDGEIELMVHRSTLYDDLCGVRQALNEKAFDKPLVVRGTHYFVVGSNINVTKGTVTSMEKDIAQRKLMDAWTFISPTHSIGYSSYKALYNLEYSALKQSLPKNIQILTLEPLEDDHVLLRLEHIFEKDEDPELSQQADVDLEDLFMAFKIVDFRETTLGGNQWLDESKPMKFRSNGGSSEEAAKHSDNEIHKLVITLAPMQIRTFVLKIQRN